MCSFAFRTRLCEALQGRSPTIRWFDNGVPFGSCGWARRIRTLLGTRQSLLPHG
jgi:hypothetical protein